MKSILKSLMLLYTFGLLIATIVFFPVRAIVVVVPIIFGLPVILGWVIGLATLPVTLISVFVNVDKYKTSKKKFFLLTLFTWVALLAIVAVITTVVYYVRQ